jgi:hypothetical protein
MGLQLAVRGNILLVCDKSVTTQNPWFFLEKLLKVLKCYNFLRVQRRHNCSPVASLVNCVMTLYLLKVHLQTFLSTLITKKCQIELSCCKWTICKLCINHKYYTILVVTYNTTYCYFSTSWPWASLQLMGVTFYRKEVAVPCNVYERTQIFAPGPMAV